MDSGTLINKLPSFGWGGNRKVVQVKEDDYDSDEGGLEKVKTHNSSVWNWRSPVSATSGRIRRSLDSARLEELERDPTLGRITTRGSLDTGRLKEPARVSTRERQTPRVSVDAARLGTPRSSTELVEGGKHKGKSNKTSSGLGYLLGVLGWR